jgi:DNA-binding XRE family transcriptional regulator
MIHRHLDVPPDTPVDELPLAAIHDLLDRGDLDDWRPLLRHIQRSPHGKLARAVERIVCAYPMYGTSPLLRAWIDRCGARRDTAAPEGIETTSLAAMRVSLGRTQEEVARAMGISQSDYSKLERRRDVKVSTLRSAAQALGGSVHLIVRLPHDTVEVVLDDER